MTENMPILFQGVSAVCFFLCVFLLKDFKKSIENMQKSIGELNVNIIALVTEDKSKAMRLDKLEKEVYALRERYHDNINNGIARIELMHLELEALKKRMDE